ncbi:hypothetical protein AMTRI_Chr07g25480 [Amborella trichopoda]|uniref:Uncharacterized protein n=1 Tax=Amborella trichopoda TaxID=13333 RepID=U5D0D1_AMBTC|nr:hypothetical protein AMTR_s00039p00208080 [Amborella trichopoda]
MPWHRATKMSDAKGSPSGSGAGDILALHKEWDDASCPICIEHPHNAVLILCTSHEKGCRSYMCDTSYRHSNCLDRFKKLRPESRVSSHSYSDSSDSGRQPTHHPYESGYSSPRTRRRVPSWVSSSSFGDFGMEETIDGDSSIAASENGGPTWGTDPYEPGGRGDDSVIGMSLNQSGPIWANGPSTYSGPSGLGRPVGLGESGLRCPLCRGLVLGWKIVKEARRYMDSKPRSCSRESCTFSGNYRELRRHARRDHPTIRPTEADPSRQRAWRRLEHQREYGDIVSAIRSAMPNAIVLGDYVIEGGDGSLDGPDEPVSSGAANPWWTTFFLFHMIGPVEEPRGLWRAWRRHRLRPGGLSAARRTLWGENLLGLREEEEEEEEGGRSDGEEGVSASTRRRRRFARPRRHPELP